MQRIDTFPTFSTITDPNLAMFADQRRHLTIDEVRDEVRECDEFVADNLRASLQVPGFLDRQINRERARAEKGRRLLAILTEGGVR